MTHQWRSLFKPIIANPSRVKILVQAICVLHNYLRSVNDAIYTPPGFTDRMAADGSVVEGCWWTHTNNANGSELSTHNARNSAIDAIEI